MAGPLTNDEKLQSSILYLLEEGADSGWSMWEDYAEEKELEISKFARFKNMLSALEREALIVKTGDYEYPPGKKKLKHWGTAVWKTTPSGHERFNDLMEKLRAWSDELDRKGGEAEPTLPIKKRIQYPVDRVVWNALMERFKSGELDVVFLAKKTD